MTSEINLAACGVCGDARVVCTRDGMRRHMGGSTPSDVYPCPACAVAVLDGDGRSFGMPGRRYGNPMIATEESYFQWKARNREKLPGWQDSALFESEERKRKQLQSTYPLAEARWVRIWVLGERAVYDSPSGVKP